MTKNAFGMINAFISLIMIPFNILLAILKGIEQNEKDQSMIRRREILNENTRSTMESREIMNDMRRERINQIGLQNDAKLAEIEYKQAMTEYIKARANLIKASISADGDEEDETGAIYMKCNDCGEKQSRHLGPLCLSCGSDNLKQIHLKV